MTSRPELLVLRVLGAAVAIVVATVLAIGWVYLLADAHVLGAGPRLSEALALQRLAHGAAQPLLRLVVAWVPAGLLGGIALRRRPRAQRAAIAFGASLVLLLLLGAVSDSVTASEPLRRHISEQPGHVSTWVGAALFALGAFLAPPWRWWRERAWRAERWRARDE